MKIKYFGHSCFSVEGSKTVVMDPHSNIGYEMPRVKADFALSSHKHFDHNALDKVDAKVKVGTMADVKDASGICLYAVETFHDDLGGKKRGASLVYKFIVDGVVFAHLGDIGEDYNDSTAAKIGDVDVLFIPVGGNYTIDCLDAKRYIEGIKPKIAVPMHYKTSKSTVDVATIDGFLSYYKNYKTVEELDLTAETLPEETQIVVFAGSRF